MSSPNPAPPTSETALPLRLLDSALAAQEPLVEKHVAWLRKNRPDASPAQILKRLESEFRGATITAGAGVGATAAVPGIGTGAAVVMSGAEAMSFLQASALYVLSRAHLQGIEVAGVEHRRGLLMAILLGDSGTKSVGKVAERTGRHWAKQIVNGIPASQLKAINKVLGHNFVTKYGTKQGVIVLGRTVPFGIGMAIGGGANALASHGVIRASHRAFGPAPEVWP